MKKLTFLLILSLVLSGCATYKFDLSQPPYSKGFVVTRDYRTIPEYTIGEGNNVAESLELAEQRFKRRRKTVESYYKQMDIIENNFARFFWTPMAMIGKTVVGVFRLPFMAYSDYRYYRDPEYKARVIEKDNELEALEQARLEKLKNELSAYIQEDLSEENR